MEGYTYGLKEILLSLQKEIANGLQKLEMGMDQGKGILLGQGSVDKGMKECAQRGVNEDGLGPVHPKTKLDQVGQVHMAQQQVSQNLRL